MSRFLSGHLKTEKATYAGRKLWSNPYSVAGRSRGVGYPTVKKSTKGEPKWSPMTLLQCSRDPFAEATKP